MRDLLDTIARGLGYLSLAVTAAVLFAAIVLNYRSVEKNRRGESAPREETPANIRAPIVGYWDDEAIEHPHPLKEPTLYVDAKTDDEAWAAIGGTAA